MSDEERIELAWGIIDKLRAEIAALKKERDTIKAIVAAQANDEGLWFIAATAPEAYLQQELRRLHAAIEAPR